MTDLERATELYHRGGFTRGGARGGASAWFARNTGINRSTVGRWPDDCWPGYARAILDLLDLIPAEDWPEGWRNPSEDT